MAKMRHKNVIKFFEQVETPTHFLNFMELAQAGDMLGFLRRRRRLDENLTRFFFRQLIIGLGYIHEQGITHRDIKLENILLDNEGVIKIADFGMAREATNFPVAERAGKVQ